MFSNLTPIAIFRQQIELLRAHSPGVLEGRLDSIHDARVTTRRIREVLPLTHEWQRRSIVDDLLPRFERMGRSLGRVRDADVRIAMLAYLEARIPPAVPSLARARHWAETDRLRLIRKLIKRCEGLAIDLEALASGAALRRTRLWAALTSSWRHQLRRLIAERAHGACAAIGHATGVYFPNRTHQARIAIKRFRYAVEIGAQAGLIADAPLVQDLKKSQDILGDLHDRQVLIDEFRSSAVRSGDVDSNHIDVVVQVVEVEIGDLHRRFLNRRAQVLESCARAQHHVDRLVLPMGTLAVAGALAVTAGLEVSRRRRASHEVAPVEPTHAVSVRIPVAVP
jgi:CHAD domain-containing protein